MRTVIGLTVLLLLVSGCMKPIVTNVYDKESNVAIAKAKKDCMDAFWTNTKMDSKDLIIAQLTAQLSGSQFDPCPMSNSYDYAKVHAVEEGKTIKYWTEFGGKVFEVTGKVVLGKFIVDGAVEIVKNAGTKYEVGGDYTGGDRTEMPAEELATE